MVTRRQFLATGAAAASVLVLGRGAAAQEGPSMYGLIGRIDAVPGRRDDLIEILVDGVGGMPGCLSYVVARDPTSEDAVWVTEVWVSREAHRASLSLPPVQAAIARGRPLIAGFSSQTETEPVGGHGLVPAPDPRGA